MSTFFNLDNVFQSSVISQNGFIKSKQSVLSTGNYRYGKNMEILISIKKAKVLSSLANNILQPHRQCSKFQSPLED